MMNLETISIQDNLFQVYRKLKDNEKWDSAILKNYGIAPMFSDIMVYFMCAEK